MSNFTRTKQALEEGVATSTLRAKLRGLKDGEGLEVHFEGKLWFEVIFSHRSYTIYKDGDEVENFKNPGAALDFLQVQGAIKKLA